jgi:hypothetical protein
VTLCSCSAKGKVKLASDWIIPDAKNGADETNSQTLVEYDYANDVPFANIGANNVGMIKLAKPLTDKELDGSKKFLTI